MAMKIFNDIIGNSNRNLPVCVALPQISALLRDYLYKREKCFCHLYNQTYFYRVHSGLLLAPVLLSISAGHILTSQRFKIHINTIVQFTHISS